MCFFMIMCWDSIGIRNPTIEFDLHHYFRVCISVKREPNSKAYMVYHGTDVLFGSRTCSIWKSTLLRPCFTRYPWQQIKEAMLFVKCLWRKKQNKSAACYRLFCFKISVAALDSLLYPLPTKYESTECNLHIGPKELKKKKKQSIIITA